ncbi:DNA-binding MurR/RpiR family transcriptional regulator [Amaricoccus macauensis]|uniref:DNA-binding MurR/RpiR family transcriptional regulator n=1 Tax=Amaricoccus macauensis TaxID=57001 RepID=A0A840SVN0_9RHOB|nr:MurR/RpiR family transcriptional regulator [Amaricoccus macauensis]MBB5223192.1 DNA-binding MurR/RpiR family transcriptional regulator [Amaricoccus macauensis]
MSTRLSLRVQEQIGRLTTSEQKLAQVILRDPAIIETHSATELARLADVSKATAARFFRTLGYSDFEEVKLQAREERNRTQPYSYAAGAGQHVALGRTIEEHMALEINNLSRTFEELLPDTLRAAVRAIEAAPRMWFLPGGDHAWFAGYGRRLFSRLRPDVFLLGQGEQSLAEDLAMTGPRDLLLVPLLGPQPRTVRPVLSHARTTRMAVLAITDHLNLALARKYAALAIHCHGARFGPLPSDTSALSLLRLLAVSYAGHVGEPAATRLELIDNIVEELDLLE